MFYVYGRAGEGTSNHQRQVEAMEDCVRESAWGKALSLLA